MKGFNKLVSFILTVALLAGMISAGTAVFAGGGNEAVAIEVAEVTVDSTDVNVYCDVNGNAHFRYEFTVDYSVQLEDGSWLSGSGNRVWYDGEYHDIAIWGETQDQVEWRPGGRYRLIAMIDRNADCEFYVNVAEERAVSLEFDDFCVVDGNTDYQSIDDNGDPYAHYRVTPNNYRITLADGSVITAEGSPYFYIDGESYLPEVYDPQPEVHWKPGGTYSVVACVFGAYTTYNVTVLENPVEAVTVNDITLIERFDGYEYDGDFYYNFHPLDCTVTFKDGAVAKTDDMGNLEWNGENYFFNVYTPSDMKNWNAGGTYKCEGDFMGVTATFNVHVVANDYASLEIAGRNELTLTLTKKDGTKETYRAKALFAGGAVGNAYSTNFITEEGRMFSGSFVFPGVPSPYDIDFDGPFYLELPGLRSNTLTGCKWLKEQFFPGGAGPDVLPGDADGNGSLDLKDVLKLRRALAGAEELTEEQEAAADVNGDGAVNMKDVLLLRRILAGVE